MFCTINFQVFFVGKNNHKTISWFTQSSQMTGYKSRLVPEQLKNILNMQSIIKTRNPNPLVFGRSVMYTFDLF